MSGENVLVIGAGALGITCAYHLQRSGADISFLVRPHRLAALSRPQHLYSFDDHSIKALAGYEVLTDPAALVGRSFDYLLLTLDGATCRSEAGIATLHHVGRALSSSSAVMIVCGVGIGLRESVITHSGFPASRVLQGSMGLLAYQVEKAEIPLCPPTDEALLGQCDIAYHHFPNRVGFILSRQPRPPSRRFARLYGASGDSRCRRLPEALYLMVSNSFFPFTTACDLDGWRGIDALAANRTLWPLCVASTKEILGLRQHGWMGVLAARRLNEKRFATFVKRYEQASLPLDFTAFNRFHHGGKVQAQDIQILDNCIAVGEREGRAMTASRELLNRWRQKKPANPERT